MANRDPGRSASRRGRIKISISMDADSLDRLDRLASRACEGNRSYLIRMMIRDMDDRSNQHAVDTRDQ